ncbi:calcium-binding protein [Marinovum sp. KMM 9879]
MRTRTYIANNGLDQIHTFAGGLDNTVNHWDTLGFERITEFSHGHHARAGGGNDIFDFQNLDNVAGTVVGRLEDFDPARDEILVEGQALDFDNLPSNVRVVAFNGGHNEAGATPQPWLLIETSGGGHIFYALEGARVDLDRDGGSNAHRHENHFISESMVPDFDSLPDFNYDDPQNVVPIGYQADGGVVIEDHDHYADDVTTVVEGTQDGDLIAAGLNDDTVRGFGGDDFIWGGSGADVVEGGSGSDEIWGGGGSDRLDGGEGRDIIRGESGNDGIQGGSHADVVRGGDGDDTLDGGFGRDRVFGGAGNDLIIDNDQDGPSGADLLVGGAGNDVIRAQGGEDTLIGGNGADILQGGHGSDVLRGGAGADELYGGRHSDRLSGGFGDDTLDGGLGRDQVYGGAGNDLILDNDQGGPCGTDFLAGGAGNDEIRAGWGDDTLIGGGGNDTLSGGYDDDLLEGGFNADALYGQRGHDTLVGGNGRDMMDGGGGNDTLIDNQQTGIYGNDVMLGGNGNDIFQIAGGDDTISGQADADTFIFIGNNIENDIVTDYEVGTDALHLDDALWGGGLTEAEVINQFATVVNGDVVLDFGGGNSVTLEGVGSTSGLTADLEIF